MGQSHRCPKTGACGDYSGAAGTDGRLPNCSVKDNAFTWNGTASVDQVRSHHCQEYGPKQLVLPQKSSQPPAPKLPSKRHSIQTCLARNTEITGAAVVTSVELGCRTCWYWYRFSAGDCCLLCGFFVARGGQKVVQEGEVLPLLDQTDEEKVWGVLKGRGEGQDGSIFARLNYIPASEGKRWEVCRVKPGRCEKQAFPWFCCQYAARQHSSFGTESLQ